MKITKKQLRELVEAACGSVSLEKDDGNVYGHGGTARMAKSQLFQIATDAAELHDMLDEKDELPEWAQSKIAVMADSIDAVFDHLEYKYRSQLGGEEIDMDDFVSVQVAEGSLNEFGTRQSSGTYSSYSSRGGDRSRGGRGARGSGYGSNITVPEIERMLPASVLRNVPGTSSILQRRAIEAGMSKQDLAAKIKAARIKEGEHPRRFFGRLGLKY
jgi:hypothetical protein